MITLRTTGSGCSAEADGVDVAGAEGEVPAAASHRAIARRKLRRTGDGGEGASLGEGASVVLAAAWAPAAGAVAAFGR